MFIGIGLALSNIKKKLYSPGGNILLSQGGFLLQVNGFKLLKL